MYDILELNQKLLAELRDIAKGLKIKRVESFKKQDLIYKILDHQALNPPAKAGDQKKEAHKEGLVCCHKLTQDQGAEITQITLCSIPVAWSTHGKRPVMCNYQKTQEYSQVIYVV